MKLQNDSRRKTFVRIVSAIVVVFFVSSMLSLPALAATKKYKNCAAVNKVYKGGIAKRGAKDKRTKGKAKYKPYVNTTLYNANKTLDKDHDGIVCEQ